MPFFSPDATLSPLEAGTRPSCHCRERCRLSRNEKTVFRVFPNGLSKVQLLSMDKRTMLPPEHHKEVARFLRERNPGGATVTAYRDSSGRCPVPIGRFGGPKRLFFSTIGAFDKPKAIPVGEYEFAACGSLPWLPNAVASSIYWLKGREYTEWPLVCEDVVRDNARSTYRHMAYMPSPFRLSLSTGQQIQWLLGAPITDREICLSLDEVKAKVQGIYPEWPFSESRGNPRGQVVS